MKMDKIKITFPDGAVKEFDKGSTPYQIAESISKRLADDSLAAKVNDDVLEMSRPINQDATIRFLNFDSDEGK